MGPYPELLELTEMEKSLLSFFVDVVCVYFPFEVIADVGSKEFECVSDGDGVLGDGWRLGLMMSSVVFDELSMRSWSVHQVTAWLICARYSVSWLLVMSPMMVESSAYLYRLTELGWDVSLFV